MSPPDRPAPVESSAPAPAVPTALRRDGTAPRPLKDRLLMLLVLIGLSLAVAIPTLLLNTFFARRPKAGPPPAAQSTGDPTAGLRASLERSATGLLPTPALLGNEPIIVKAKPERMAARQEKVTRLAEQFGGTATDGLATGNERHLYVDLPAASVEAFRRAVRGDEFFQRNGSANDPVDASPAPAAAGSPAGGREHLEVFIRPNGEDE